MSTQKPKGIDYSKWDNIDYGSSDDGDGDGHGDSIGDRPHKPRVIRLDEPSQVTRAPDGTLQIESTGKTNTDRNSATAATTTYQTNASNPPKVTSSLSTSGPQGLSYSDSHLYSPTLGGTEAPFDAKKLRLMTKNGGKKMSWTIEINLCSLNMARECSIGKVGHPLKNCSSLTIIFLMIW